MESQYNYEFTVGADKKYINQQNSFQIFGNYFKRIHELNSVETIIFSLLKMPKRYLKKIVSIVHMQLFLKINIIHILL